MPEIETLLRNKGIIPDEIRKWKSEEMVKAERKIEDRLLVDLHKTKIYSISRS